MSSESLNLKVLRVKGNNLIFMTNMHYKVFAEIYRHACPNATQITQKEADELLNLIDIDNTLAFIHFNQLWEKYREIKNLY